jgi:hypothetical protein
MDPQLVDKLVGFVGSSPIIGLLLYFLNQKSKELEAQAALVEKRTEQLLAIIPRMIEAENDMTNALNMLSGKIK